MHHSGRLGISYKLNVWRSCGYSTMTYGLCNCGLTGDQAGELQKSIMKHTRAVISNQAFLTGETHDSIVHGYRLPCGLEDLRQELRRATQRLTGCSIRPDRPILARGWSRSHPRLPLEGDTGAETYAWACPFCEDMFPTQAALKVHARRAHQHTDDQPIVFSRAEHSLGGLPTCRFCHKKLSRWQALAHTALVTAVPNISPLTPPSPQHCSLPLLRQTSVTHEDQADLLICQQEQVIAAAKKGLNSFIRLKDVTSRLQQTCALCGQWVASHRTMKRRYQYTHPDVLQALGNSIASLIRRTATACPTCHFCNVQCKDWREHGNALYFVYNRTDLDELDEFFGSVRTNNQGVLSNKRRRPPPGITKKHHPQPDLLFTLARQVVRQEEEIKLLKQDHSIVMFLRPGEYSMLGHLFQTAKAFKAVPGQQPLKTVMALALLTELGPRLQAVCQDQATWPRNSDVRPHDRLEISAVEPATQSPGGGLVQAATLRPGHCDTLTEIVPDPGSGQGASIQLHPERKMADVMEAPATFQLDLSTRTTATLEAWASLLALQGCTVLQLGGVAYKRETLKPSPAVAKIKDSLRGR